MRIFRYNILTVIKERWSPKAFSQKQVPRNEINAIIEAAHFAPSCFNEQPWRFVVADTPEGLKPFHDALLDNNALWAKKAPAMILICGQKEFHKTGKDNPYHTFDSGTSWGFLSLEAQSRGLITHAMAGFKKTQIKEMLFIPPDWTIIALVAVGYPGTIEDLDESLWEMEKPNERVDVESVIYDVSTMKKRGVRNGKNF